ncbi:MAG: sulfotransferase [Tahibacter sp.]
MPVSSRHVPFFQRYVGAFFERYPAVGPRLARWESASVSEDFARTKAGPPVWICGMARAGSTVLLELLHGSGEFAAHRYSDYPLVWTPYWWNRLRERLPMPVAVPVERAHHDRLRVTPESPEAFEEIFWMSGFPRRHDPHVDQVLDRNTSNPDFERFFDEHQRKLLAVRGKSRYLSKANYHLPRLGYLARLYPDARFIIPVRDPLAQVASLVKQDRLFARLDAEDPQVSRHLARIGHYEFGPHKRALHLGDAALTQLIGECHARGESARAYALQWQAQYGYALDLLVDDVALCNACLWVSFETLCREPRVQLGRIAAHLGLGEAQTNWLEAQADSLSQPDYYASSLNAAETAQVAEITGQVWRRATLRCESKVAGAA